MKTISLISEMTDISHGLKKAGKKVCLIPTMGKLHEGHLRLIEEGKKYGEVVVSVFVNPLQFGENEDFDKYPRDIQADKAILEKSHVPFLFNPGIEIVENTATFLENPAGSRILCGLFRPGHFQGVLTVVMKLFQAVTPDFAFFGLKDYQQYILIKKMVSDYFLPIGIVPVATVREDCGLAMSSRNGYFSKEEKKAACGFYKSLKKTADLFGKGEKSTENLSLFCVKELIKSGFSIEYVRIMDPDLRGEKEFAENGDIILSAVNFAGVRLIDNIFFG